MQAAGGVACHVDGDATVFYDMSKLPVPLRPEVPVDADTLIHYASTDSKLPQLLKVAGCCI